MILDRYVSPIHHPAGSQYEIIGSMAVVGMSLAVIELEAEGKVADKHTKAELIRKLKKLQAKAKRKRSISTHGFPRDNQASGSTDDLPAYMRPTNGEYC